MSVHVSVQGIVRAGLAGGAGTAHVNVHGTAGSGRGDEFVISRGVIRKA